MPSSDVSGGNGFDLNEFDFERAVLEWGVRAAALGASGEAIAELEDHLREEFARYVRGGRTGEQAWALAVGRLGDPAAIGREFAKLDRLPAIDLAALGGIIACGAVVMLAFLAFMAGRAPEVVQRPVLTMHTLAIRLGYLSGLLAAAVSAYATVRRLATRSALPALSGAALRVARAFSLATCFLVVAGFVLGAVWAADAWGRPFRADARELGALAVAASFFAVAATAWAGARAARLAPAIAIAGGGAVLAAWFVAGLGPNAPAWAMAVGFGGLGIAMVLAGLSFHAMPPTTLRR